MPKKLPVCGYSLDGVECMETGDHFCTPRADHVQAFIEELLVHTKGAYARKRFVLTEWQANDIVRPLFGRVVWSDEQQAYTRQYRIAWVEIARKQGKSELLAALMLYLLIGDGEESAELYGVARDRDQASLAFDVAARMIQLSPILSKRLQIKQHVKRIIDPKTASVYAVIAADAAGALGANPSGVSCDEILAWRDGSMWHAMRTGMGSGARRQPLMIAATTAGNDMQGFAGQMHTEMERVSNDPTRAPHIFVYMRNTPRDADPFDEANWYGANPALGDFLSLESLRQEAQEAKNDPQQLNSFLQFRLNMWVSQAFRWMPMHLYNAEPGILWENAAQGRTAFKGRTAWAGFDLAARFDLTAWCLAFPDEHGGLDLLWRFWLPEKALQEIDKRNNGLATLWARQGWLTVTSGEVLDYDRVYSDIEQDAKDFVILGADCDQWSMYPVIQEIGARTGLDHEKDIFAYKNDYSNMSPGMISLMALVRKGQFRHHGNPIAEFCFDAVEVRKAAYDPELIRPDKPDRGSSGKRIDGVVASVLAINAWSTRGSEDRSSVYEYSDLFVL